MHNSPLDRRHFLQYTSASLLAGGMLSGVSKGQPLLGAEPSGPIKEVERTVVHSGYDGVYCWVHPRAGAIPGKTPSVVMTMQKLWLKGSDIFQPLKEMRTDDLGETWSGPSDTSFAHREEEGGITAGVCDFTPAWHAKTKTLLGIGHTVRYENNHVQKGRRKRETSFATYDNDSRTWSDWDVVQMPDMKNKFYHSGAGCSQRVDLPDGDLLIPFYFSDGINPHRKVSVMRCAFDGKKVEYLEHGSELDIPTHRGALEPSLTYFQDEFFVTIRHGDGHGYVARSKDGLQFSEPQPWKWDDGTELSTGDTQQHWISHQDGFYLVFTYKREDNQHVFRQRAPLFMAEVDPETLSLKKETLQVLVPERGARLGNFQVVTVSPQESWVTVTEWMQPVGCEKRGSDNSVYAVKIKWNTPNEYAVG
ncbi:hypothetical protein Pla110_10210 [Polystyrenella longa]|uniref:Sialidase domain-containing protein n=1 Tax=Polystyrenella longa TaxID=2528007 RepID=A0A518CJB2_9PLAN|nr:sialidase family protein [Polystyrenella longa]QDU79313.1 hypothetical protein Pla110_10210 [Polystyrenella longa]